MNCNQDEYMAYGDSFNHTDGNGSSLKRTVIIGGTFDILHKGHRNYIKQAFNNANKVHIQLSSDELASFNRKKYRVKPFQVRKNQLMNYINSFRCATNNYEIHCVNSRSELKKFCTQTDKLDLMIATQIKDIKLFRKCNELRYKNSKKKFKILKVKIITDKNGKKLSSTEINRKVNNHFYQKLTHFIRYKADSISDVKLAFRIFF